MGIGNVSKTNALVTAANRLKAETDAVNYDQPTEMYYDPNGADAEMEAIRPEMYKNGAVIASDITTKMHRHMRKKFPPYGLISKENEIVAVGDKWTYVPKPLTRFADYTELYAAFSYSSLHFTTELYRLPNHLSGPYKSLELLVKRAHEAQPAEARYESTANFFWSGFNIAALMTIGALAGINSLYKSSVEEPQRDRFVSLAKGSMCLVSPIAEDNIWRLGAYNRAIGAEVHTYADNIQQNYKVPAFNANLLKIVSNLDDPLAYVDYIKSPEQLIDPRMSRKVGALAVPYATQTCLGAVKFSGVEPAISVVWNWLIEPFADLRYHEV